MLQSGEPGDLDCLNLRVFVDLRTSSATWKQRLQPSTDDRQQQEEDGDKEAGEAEGPLHVVLFDHCGLAAIFLSCSLEPTIAMFTVLRKLWQCVGLGSDEGDEGQTWKGTEVLTTLLACLGFAWKDDVEMLWDGTVNGITVCSEVLNTMQLPKASWLKHKERQEMAPYIAQLNAFLGNWQQRTSTEVPPLPISRMCRAWRKESRTHVGSASWIRIRLYEYECFSLDRQAKTRELVVRCVRRFIGQQRLSRFVSYIRQRIQGGGAWPPSDDFTLECVDGYEVLPPPLSPSLPLSLSLTSAARFLMTQFNFSGGQAAEGSLRQNVGSPVSGDRVLQHLLRERGRARLPRLRQRAASRRTRRPRRR